MVRLAMAAVDANSNILDSKKVINRDQVILNLDGLEPIAEPLQTGRVVSPVVADFHM